MTVLEAIQRSTDFLAKKGVDSPRLQVELLLAHVLAMPRMKLYLNFDRSLTETETNALRDMVKRRGNREPLQHIVGSTSFCGLEIAVNPHVLVPRPETEILAERAWTFLAKISPPAIALDLCTGSGCLAIAMATHSPGARLYATDISAEALDCARQNVTKHNVADRIELLQGDGFTPIPAEVSFDLIVSNPPYISSAEIETLEPEVRDFDPRLALDGGTDGLDFYRRIAADARRFLKPDGRIMLEFGDGQATAIAEIFHAQNWVVETIERDYTQRERILIAHL
ncbi:MAG: Release factor glutamine methyltransferase [Verrucomicrobiales bacterium]|nr:Release factor glutamine methyltransferase [Verrucomicrobiales bacterium]